MVWKARIIGTSGLVIALAACGDDGNGDDLFIDERFADTAMIDGGVTVLDSGVGPDAALTFPDAMYDGDTLPAPDAESAPDVSDAGVPDAVPDATLPDVPLFPDALPISDAGELPDTPTTPDGGFPPDVPRAYPDALPPGHDSGPRDVYQDPLPPDAMGGPDPDAGGLDARVDGGNFIDAGSTVRDLGVDIDAGTTGMDSGSAVDAGQPTGIYHLFVRRGNGSVFTLRHDMTGASIVSPVSRAPLNLQFFPGGDSVVFFHGHLRVADIDAMHQIIAASEQATTTPLGPLESSPVPSPNGMLLAYTESDVMAGTAALRVKDPNPTVTTSRSLTSGLPPNPQIGYQASWSPNSNEVTFVHGPSALTKRVYVADANTGLATSLTQPGSHSYPSWRPGTDDIAYIAPGSVRMVNRTTGVDREIFSSFPHPNCISFDPTGRYLGIIHGGGELVVRDMQQQSDRTYAFPGAHDLFCFSGKNDISWRLDSAKVAVLGRNQLSQGIDGLVLDLQTGIVRLQIVDVDEFRYRPKRVQ